MGLDYFLEKWGDVNQRVQTSSYKMNSFGDPMYSMVTIVNDIESFKVTRRLDLKCSHHRKRKVIM